MDEKNEKIYSWYYFLQHVILKNKIADLKTLDKSLFSFSKT